MQTSTQAKVTSTAQLDMADQFGRHIITSLEDSFIQRHINQPVTVFLTNGVKLSGVITTNSPKSFLLSRDGHTQLVMTHSVATIMPNESL